MCEAEVEFDYESEKIVIQCGKNTKLKDIYKNFKFKANAEGKQLFYLYKGTILESDELTFEDIANQLDEDRNKMNVLVTEGERQLESHDCIIKSGKIICPECQEDILLT